jgi:hypothetical protein
MEMLSRDFSGGTEDKQDSTDVTIKSVQPGIRKGVLKTSPDLTVG